jgi:hypothetical protein
LSWSQAIRTVAARFESELDARPNRASEPIRLRLARLEREHDHNREREKKMKSAYELAMERLEKKAPSVALTDEQKEQIAEVDSTFKARIAEKELFLKDEIAKAQQAGNAEEAESLQKQLTIEIRRLQEDAEAKKEKLRASFAG